MYAHARGARWDRQGKIYPSRGLSNGADIRAGGRGDRRDLRDFAGGGGWPRDAEHGGLFDDSGCCNSSARGRSGDTDRTPHRRKKSSKNAGERVQDGQVAPAQLESSGQPAPIMSAWLSPITWRSADRAANEKPRLLDTTGVLLFSPPGTHPIKSSISEGRLRR